MSEKPSRRDFASKVLYDLGSEYVEKRWNAISGERLAIRIRNVVFRSRAGGRAIRF